MTRLNEQHNPAVIMKLDIEGKEVDVVPDLMMSGALSSVDLIMAEWHPWMWTGVEKNRSDTAKASIDHLAGVIAASPDPVHKIEVVEIDDEDYAFSDNPLPNC